LSHLTISAAASILASCEDPISDPAPVSTVVKSATISTNSSSTSTRKKVNARTSVGSKPFEPGKAMKPTVR
jgi:hypothetical protein